MKHLFTGAAIAALIAAAAPAMAKELKLSDVRPADATINKELAVFADDVKAGTHGDVTIKLFPSSELGNYTTVQQRVSLGAIDMAVQPASTDTDRKMQISSFPYLAENWKQARAVYGPGGVIRDTMAKLFQKQDITMLAAYPVYFGGIALNRAPISPGDPSVKKGIKVRVPGIKSFQLLGQALGYIPAPIPFSDAYTAVQTGVVDGVIGSGAEGYYASFRDVTKTYIPANTHFEVWYLTISNETLNALSPEDRKALQTAATTFETKRWTVAEADQAKNVKKLEGAGAKVVDLSDAQLEAMSKKVRAEVWPVILTDIGKDWGSKILDKAKAQEKAQD
ncbi:TRAP transporter substrate-binding protein DctP [Acidimangrovimonas sediminis]|uniref:TRAP transporter substrate-binding protein DctP n=1 Tax=Acidimangrovimonas sediminis TaxID=2056283 RepID=UPI001E40B4C7|nr:TRAP transporter substrate-binding protein DctP [Acidimangrovimonas sediminis]